MATIRQEIVTLLCEEELNALDISQMLSVREKEVYEHLEHVNRTLRVQGKKLVIEPYKCLGCGYVFKDRGRFTRPGRCPRCKGGHIRMASYRIYDRQ